MTEPLMPDPRLAAAMPRWSLTADGEPIVTRHSRLLPVRRGGVPAMLKVALSAEERAGASLLRWWDGAGAARLLARHGDAVLMERACGPRSLFAMARDGRDDEACGILCDVATMLHEAKPKPLPRLVPLAAWFEGLAAAAATHGGVLRRAWASTARLLAEPRDVCALHGDLHHGNVLDFGARGWLAIDPKGLLGERTFDYAALFLNPDLADPSVPVATMPGRLVRRAGIVAEAAGLERDRLLAAVTSWAGLSAAWSIGEGRSPAIALGVAEAAAAVAS